MSKSTDESRKIQRDRMREYRKNNPEYVKKGKQLSKEHRRKHRDKYLKQQLERQAANKRLVNTYKDKPCMDCGVKYPPYVMDFDHVRGNKLGSVSEMCNNRPVATILAEIEKCDLVCSNCHRVRTHNRYENPFDYLDSQQN